MRNALLPSTSLTCHPAAERTDAHRLTINGKRQTIHLCAYGWETRNSWGHSAYCPELGLSAKCRYYNRTWEAHRFDSVMDKLLETCRMRDRKYAAKRRAENRLLNAYCKAKDDFYKANGYEGSFMCYEKWIRENPPKSRKSRKSRKASRA